MTSTLTVVFEDLYIPTHEFDASAFNKDHCALCGLPSSAQREGTGLWIHPTSDDTAAPAGSTDSSSGSPSSSPVALPSLEDQNYGVVVTDDNGEDRLITVVVPGRYARSIAEPDEATGWTANHLLAEMGRIADEQQQTLAKLRDRVGDAVLHREYQKLVAQTAIDFAIKYDWCEEVLTALETMGIRIQPPRVHLTWSVTHGLDIEVPFDELRDFFRDTHGYVETLLMDFAWENPQLKAELERHPDIKYTGSNAGLADSVLLPIELAE